MEEKLNISVECKANGNILLKSGDQILYTCANARELVPYMTRMGIGLEDSGKYLTEAIICLEKLLHAANRRHLSGNGADEK